MFMEKETPKVSPARYFHTGAIMTPFIIHDIMGDVRSAVLSCQACWWLSTMLHYNLGIITYPTNWHIRKWGLYRTSIDSAGVFKCPAVYRFLFLNFSFLLLIAFIFNHTFLLYSFCNMHKVQIQYAIQYAIQNTICTKCIYTLCSAF